MYIRIVLGFVPTFFTSKYSFLSGVGYVMRLILLIMWTTFQSFILRDNKNNNNSNNVNENYNYNYRMNVTCEFIRNSEEDNAFAPSSPLPLPLPPPPPPSPSPSPLLTFSLPLLRSLIRKNWLFSVDLRW